ncbi:MAG: PAS domain S-box protein [Sediminibacterium sp.]|nr:PAS domain S-box protein [Sediminibacterium sp.]
MPYFEPELKNSFINTDDILSRINQAMIAVNEQWIFTYANQLAGKYFGKDHQLLLGKNIWDEFPEKKGELFYQKCEEAFHTQTTVYVEEFNKNQHRWYEYVIYPSSTGLTICIMDITEKKNRDLKEIELKTKISEADIKFFKTFHENPIPLSLRDLATHTIVDANQSLLDLLGYKKEDFVGKQLNQIKLIIDDNNDQDYYESFLNQKELYKSERIIQMPSGKKVNVLVSRSVIVVGGRELTLTSFVDITHILIAERKIKENIKIAQDFKYALDESAIITFTDAKGIITYANDNFCETSGYSREELIGSNHRIVNANYHPQAFFSKLWNTVKAGKIFREDIKSKSKNGQYYWDRTTIVPFLDENEVPFQFVAIRYDITEEKKAEEKLMEQFLKLKEIAWIQSHLVRAPLAKIMGLADLISKDICTFEEQKELLLGILNSSKELDEMIRSIIDKTAEIEKQEE